MTTLENRVALLERSARRWRVGFFAALIAAVGLACLAGAAARQPKVVEAEEFRLVDAAGKMRATLSNVDKGASLRMFDDAGKKRVVVGVAGEHATVKVADSNEQDRAAITASNAGSGLMIMRGDGKTQAVVGGTADGDSSISVLDPTAGTSLLMAMKGGNPITAGKDKDGNSIWTDRR